MDKSEKSMVIVSEKLLPTTDGRDDAITTIATTTVVTLPLPHSRPTMDTYNSYASTLTNSTCDSVAPSIIAKDEIASSASSVTMYLKPHDDVERGYSSDIPLDHNSSTESPLPSKIHGKSVRNLRYIVMAIYKRVFAFIFLVNIGTLIWMMATSATVERLGTACTANFLVTVLSRQESIVNLIYIMVVQGGKRTPLWLRLKLANVYKMFGGAHSGTSVSATFWLIFMIIRTVLDYYKLDNSEKLEEEQLIIKHCIIAIAYIILAIILGILTTAHPTLRNKMHNTFEFWHRFAGWTTVVLFWVLVLLLIQDSRASHESYTQALIKTPSFWFLIIITLSIFSSWRHVRKVHPRAERLSEHAMRLHFDDEPRAVPGSFDRISYGGLQEWHAFATISMPHNDKKGFSMVVSRAGDWTSRCIDNPPPQMWIRGIPVRGVAYCSNLFQRIILVGTGSGIGPCLPVLAAMNSNNNIKARLLWSAPTPRKTFGDDLVDSVLTADPAAFVYDTKALGRPDMVKLVYNMYQAFNAEAVVIISNPNLTKKIVYGCESRGIPAFGPIFDS